MTKVFLIVGMVCVQSFQCWTFQPEKVIHYETKQECLADGKRVGDDMYSRMKALNIPVRLRVWCQETNQHGEYS